MAEHLRADVGIDWMDHPCGNPRDDGPGRHVLGHHRLRRHDGATADFNACRDVSAGSDYRQGPNRRAFYREGHQAEALEVHIVVVYGTNAWADKNIVLDRHGAGEDGAIDSAGASADV